MVHLYESGQYFTGNFENEIEDILKFSFLNGMLNFIDKVKNRQKRNFEFFRDLKNKYLIKIFSNSNIEEENKIIFGRKYEVTLYCYENSRDFFIFSTPVYLNYLNKSSFLDKKFSFDLESFRFKNVNDDGSIIEND
ncbi:hypothetical protein DMUE_3807 [Dictyocoela muelleri]|nr:hypothetical protein DMUE_3807 [Dictyocoela muelleri]